MSNQGAIQAAVRTRHAQPGNRDWNGDWHALWDVEAIPTGTWNGRMLAWINSELSSSYTSLPGAMQAYAESLGFYNWSSMNTIGAGVEEDVLFSETLVALTGALNNFTLVVRIRMDDGSSPVAPDFTVTGAKVTVQGPIAKVYLGVWAGSGDDWDAASLTQVFFGGNPGVAQDEDAMTQSDLVSFSWNKTDPLLISMYTGAVNSGSRNLSFTNYADLFHLSGSDVAASPDKSGLSFIGNNLYFVPSVTLFGE